MEPQPENLSLTPYPEVNLVLQDLLTQIKPVLQARLVGMYVEGSLANGGFDEDSDIDFIVVTDGELPENIFSALQAVHERINSQDTQWTTNLEGFYISRAALRRHDPQHAACPNLERGPGERLKLVHLDETWIVHRYILRQCGISLTGPDPKTLIDPVSPADLRKAMLPALRGWGAEILNNPHEIIHRGYQSYTVLTVCRILHTFQTGEVASKLAAAGWARETLDARWRPLIDRAWVGRHNPGLPASEDDIAQTLDLLRYAIQRVEHS